MIQSVIDGEIGHGVNGEGKLQNIPGVWQNMH